MTNIPRNPNFYYPSTHAVQQQKHRDIRWELIAETIRTGELKGSHKENCELFVKDFTHTNHPVGVVANYVEGEVITVEWRYES